jgi:hypothetical protein
MNRTFLLAALFAAGLFPWSLRAQPSTLANQPRFGVVVENLNSGAQQCGLTEPQVQTDVEIRLRRSGAVVVPPLVGTYFYVNVHTVPIQSWGASLGACAYNISLEFRQQVYLSGHRITAATWDTAMLGISSETSGRQIRDSLGDLVDKFLNDWLSVNNRGAR